MTPNGDAAAKPARRRLALLVNTIAPYRLPVYSALAEQFDMHVLHGGYEPNRSWRSKSGSTFTSKPVWTMQIRARKHTGTDGVCDVSYVHLNLGLLWELPRCRPDLLISNELGLRTLIAILYAKATGIPLWVWWGGTMHSERNVHRSRRILRGVLKHGIRHWLSYGLTSTEYLQSLGVPRERILELQNCVEQERFVREPAVPADWFPGSPGPLLLAVGQFIDRKGLDKLIEACGRLQARGRTCTLVLVGSGCEQSKLEALAEAHNLQHLHILPEQPQAVLNQLYRRADALVFPTLEDVWGLVVNEALWAGCPVLCSIYAGCAREIVPVGNLFDPANPADFDAALEKALNGSLVPASASAGAMQTHQQVSARLLEALLTETPIQPDHETSPGTVPEDQAVCSL